MKEATGELNMTVVTVVAIAAIGAFFYAFIWPNIQTNLETNTRCSTAQFCQTSSTANMMDCKYMDPETNQYVDIECPNNDTTK